MNGQHLRSLPSEELTKLIGERWKNTGILTQSDGPFIEVRLHIYLEPSRMFWQAPKRVLTSLDCSSLGNLRMSLKPSPTPLQILYARLDKYDDNTCKVNLYEQEAVAQLKDGIDLITDSDKALSNLLSYPLYATLTR